jgi:hypothetical protein
MSTFPKPVLITPVVKAIRDDVIADGVQCLTLQVVLDLIGSHEQLRAIALVKGERLRQTEHERARLQAQLESLTRDLARKGRM